MVLGVTGSFGSGKSTVAGMFRDYGAGVLDADRIAHQSIRPGTAAYRRVVSVFGKGVLKKGRTIDRRKLGKIVFADKGLLVKLNGIIHPEVIAVIKKEIRKAKAQGKSKAIVLDVPLLIEAGLVKLADKIIVVKSGPATQAKRAMKRTGLSGEEIMERIKSQIPLRAKMRLADFIIDNNGTLDKTKKQVARLAKELFLIRS